MSVIPASSTENAVMDRALVEARRAATLGEVPVGAVVLGADGRVLAAAHNQRECAQDPTAHAEVLALRAAARVHGSRVLDDCTLVVTLEPCVMCAGAILAARVPRVVFGAWETKSGAVGSVLDLLRDARLPFRVTEVVSGVRERECAALLAEFFRQRRSAEGRASRTLGA